ncbi:hypothetical protein EVAR_99008_1 [Eumeta japonica]|uniref:Uncharacterized protein n=1 Tax=Eumeta variegata TaxID=151549 RepID=A0A4C1XYP8_EUMVA|nr:hypothetical protein EVAR_99008_1 [Eumeta japonica]
MINEERPQGNPVREQPKQLSRVEKNCFYRISKKGPEKGDRLESHQPRSGKKTPTVKIDIYNFTTLYTYVQRLRRFRFVEIENSLQVASLNFYPFRFYFIWKGLDLKPPRWFSASLALLVTSVIITSVAGD